MNNITKYLVASASAITVFVALMALVHTPKGLAMWGRLRGTQSCPLGMDGGGSPQERDARRAAQNETLRGPGRAASSVFLGWELNKSSRADVDAWAQAQGAVCHMTKMSSTSLECNTAHAAGNSVEPGVPSTWFFAFDSRDILKSIHAMTHYPDAHTATAAFVQLRERAEANFGSLSRQSGEADAGYLSAGVLRQTAAEFRVQDVFAKLIATRLPASYLVEQKYRALVD